MWVVEETDPAAEADVEEVLGMRLPQVEFDGIPFGDVVAFLRDVGNLNVHVRWQALAHAGVDKNTPVDIKLAHVRLEKALRTILDDVGEANRLGFVVDEGVVTISTRDDLSRRTVTRVYDVRDLVARAPAAPVPARSAKNESGLFGKAGRDGEQKVPERIMDLIRAVTGPDTWQPVGTGCIHYLKGKVIVQHTRFVHRRLSRLLAALREETPTIPEELQAAPPVETETMPARAEGPPRK